jgi:7,8-dihydropterin-6-yl-methyl-4-(beta-D-ribofuranosyl)aminobenzene 5'-phosphate synthase
VLDTPAGQVILVGCSHPGIETILAKVAERNPEIGMLVGGLHWVDAAPDEIVRLADALHERWQIERIAPGHCSGERAFLRLRERFGPNYLYAGVGSLIPL